MRRECDKRTSRLTPYKFLYTISMKIYIGADHRGFELKNKLTEWLTSEDHEVIDCGNDHYDPEDDNPDFAQAVARGILKHADTPDRLTVFGIVICGSGVGVTIAVNRFKALYCALGFDVQQVQHARANDHINVLSIPSEYVTFEKAKEMVTVFLTTEPLDKDKYLRRLKKMDL